jgi:hypothetical protein
MAVLVAILIDALMMEVFQISNLRHALRKKITPYNSNKSFGGYAGVSSWVFPKEIENDGLKLGKYYGVDQNGVIKGYVVRVTQKKELNVNEVMRQIIISLLEGNPGLQPIILLNVLDHHAPGLFDPSHLRTLQRRVKRGRAKHGSEKEVIFRQNHIPGKMGISDYSWMNYSALSHKPIINWV